MLTARGAQVDIYTSMQQEKQLKVTNGQNMHINFISE